MSATGRNIPGHDRRADDFYATPAWVTEAILPHLTPGPVLDPCCGDGAILDVVRRCWTVDTRGIELDMLRAQTAYFGFHRAEIGDALAREWPLSHQVITNPPYQKAIEFIRHALRVHGVERLTVDLAFLLRLNFLGSQKRAAFHREHPSDVFVLPRRPSFTGAGTDATEYAWFVWGPGRGGTWSILDVETIK